ncbi:PTS sugar transporter subunit IIB [Pediococcus ethanolidurans]|uniref:PTS system, mannose-specific IIB component n=1 Tax=Pediococcus ethanolidurans TaxID=319653 RepID=A0A0R2K210_9LACO|nr:PTS sugar transporter subunit IIB [Pediococcus ethanolidurans]KRN83630.1 hypothetical protein IV87_GL000099 [Pediococcus ethanolidurans]GEN94015.1 PTS mannose transporter subunit IIA [Pediococcus ethanolidurans]SER01926.1 PTS system, mannose-specific IIB component [Pediococcus ethanolidurans]
MISLLRVDDRLIHGQVAVTWTSYLSADTIVVSNDRNAKDPFLQMALTLAKPPSVDLEILTTEDTIKFCNDTSNKQRKMFLVVESTDDALVLTKSIPDIKKVILGGIRKAENRYRIDRQVFLSQNDLSNCDSMISLGKHVSVQVIPSEKEFSITEAKKIYAQKQ